MTMEDIDAGFDFGADTDDGCLICALIVVGIPLVVAGLLGLLFS